jgi:hypothetical protein
VLLRVPLKWALVVRGDDNAQKEPPADSHVLAVQALWEGANGELPEVRSPSLELCEGQRLNLASVLKTAAAGRTERRW